MIDEVALRTRLEEELEALREIREGAADARKPVALDQQSVGRLSRMDAMQQQSMALATEERRKLQIRRIEAALERLDDGEYGYCVSCGDDIAPKRLEIDPTIPTCTTCASGADR